MPILPPHLMPLHPVDRIMADQRRDLGLRPLFDPPEPPRMFPVHQPWRVEALTPLGCMETLTDHGNGTLTSFDPINRFRRRTFLEDLSRPGVYFEDPNS